MNDFPSGLSGGLGGVLRAPNGTADRARGANARHPLPARRDALEEALDLSKEARLRIQAGYTETAEESAALAHLQAALDEVQQLLNAIDPCYEPMLASAQAHAEAAADVRSTQREGSHPAGPIIGGHSAEAPIGAPASWARRPTVGAYANPAGRRSSISSATLETAAPYPPPRWDQSGAHGAEEDGIAVPR